MNTEQQQKQKGYAQRHYQTNKPEILSKNRKYRRGVKERIFNILGNICVLCGFDNKLALQIDHVNGGGYAHRQRIGITGYYGDILKQVESGSKGFRLLCANCNQIQAVLLGHRKSIWS